MANVLKYKPEYCQQLIDYFKNIKQGEATEVEYYQDGEIKREKGSAPVYPTFEMFATMIGVNHSTIYDWEKSYPEFNEAMEFGRSVQKSMLQQLALSKTYDGNFAKYLLTVRWKKEFGEVHDLKVEGGLDIVVSYGKDKKEEVPALAEDEGTDE